MVNIACPLFYYETYTLFMDDDESFLDLITTTFDELRPIVFNSQEDPRYEKITGENFKYEFSKNDVNCDDLIRVIHDEKKKNKVSVFIVDYNMPRKNGLEICDELKYSPFQKILLTGVLGNETAIEAFNNNLIDGYINKSSPYLVNEIIENSKKATHKYFVSESRKLQYILSHDELELFSKLEIADLIQRIVKEKNIKEYYYLFSLNSFLMKNENGEFYRLCLLDKAHFESLIEISMANQAPEKLISALKTYEKLPLFPTVDGYYTPDYEENWQHYLCDAKKILNHSDIKYVLAKIDKMSNFQYE